MVRFDGNGLVIMKVNTGWEIPGIIEYP